MTIPIWYNRLQKFAAGDRLSSDDFAALRGELLDLWLLARSIPPDVLMRFESIPDSELIAASSAAEAQILRGRLGFELPSYKTNDGSLMLTVGAQLHALDQILADHLDFGPASDPGKKYFVKTKSHKGYIIPRRYKRRRLGRKNSVSPTLPPKTRG
jgi:hypothetical protein